MVAPAISTLQALNPEASASNIFRTLTATGPWDALWASSTATSTFVAPPIKGFEVEDFGDSAIDRLSKPRL